MNNIFLKYLKFLGKDAKQDRTIKTAWRLFIRILIIGLLYIFEYLNWITYSNSDLIISYMTTIIIVLSMKDLVIDNIPKLEKLNIWYNFIIEGCFLLSIILITFIINLYNHEYNLAVISPALMIGLALNFLVMSLLNLILAYYEYAKNGKYEGTNFLLFHNGLIIIQTLGVLIFALGLYGDLTFSDFYSEFFKFWIGGNF